MAWSLWHLVVVVVVVVGEGIKDDGWWFSLLPG